jgi:hypothetical protein
MTVAVGDACVQDTVEMSTKTALGCEDVLVFDDEHTYYDCCCDYREPRGTAEVLRSSSSSSSRAA